MEKVKLISGCVVSLTFEIVDNTRFGRVTNVSDTKPFKDYTWECEKFAPFLTHRGCYWMILE